MNKAMKIFLLFYSVVFASTTINGDLLSSQDYYTDSDCVIRMNINIIGHVKNPGVFSVYDGMDVLSALSLAGGYLNGADLKNIHIYNVSGESYVINLDSLLNSKKKEKKQIYLQPRDTIYIKQRKLSKIFTSSNLPSLFLNILNIALTISRTN
tara:strand:+ start:235 stop:693 length:459 start_codon:yes stop_codon:yes gene_type:complete